MRLKPNITAEQFMEELIAYTTEWKRLYAELDRTPTWRFIRWHRLLNKLSQLTKNYADKHFEED